MLRRTSFIPSSQKRQRPLLQTSQLECQNQRKNPSLGKKNVLMKRYQIASANSHCVDPGELVLPIIKELYANFKGMKDDYLCIRGVCVEFNKLAINEILHCPNFEEVHYKKFMSEEVNIVVLESQLWQTKQVVPWQFGKKDQYVNFHANGLAANYGPLLKFVCCRIIPASHVSNVIWDRAVFHFANVKGLKIDVGILIFAQVLESVIPSKGLCFPILITKIFKIAGVKMGQKEECVKPGMPITTKKTTKKLDVPRVILGTKATVDGRATLHVSSAHESKGVMMN